MEPAGNRTTRMNSGLRFDLTLHKDFQSSQFSTRKPGILAKSDRLRVSNRPSWTRQMAAIVKSIVPERRRWRFRFSNQRAADSSDGRIGKRLDAILKSRVGMDLLMSRSLP